MQLFLPADTHLYFCSHVKAECPLAAWGMLLVTLYGSVPQLSQLLQLQAVHCLLFPLLALTTVTDGFNRRILHSFPFVQTAIAPGIKFRLFLTIVVSSGG